MAKVVNYIKESYDELVNKVSWPTWSELQNSAIVVTVAAFIFAFVIFIMDFIFGANPGITMFWKGLLGFYYEMFGR
ncbi:MAG: preprotein translocase subunit SecE [Bacteroidales bacterium]|nr:preprotein translocase subunit SecE [Bacteroidales bacterium]